MKNVLPFFEVAGSDLILHTGFDQVASIKELPTKFHCAGNERTCVPWNTTPRWPRCILWKVRCASSHTSHADYEKCDSKLGSAIRLAAGAAATICRDCRRLPDYLLLRNLQNALYP